MSEHRRTQHHHPSNPLPPPSFPLAPVRLPPGFSPPCFAASDSRNPPSQQLSPTPGMHPVPDTCQLGRPHQSAERRSSFSPLLMLLTSLFPLRPSVNPTKVTHRRRLRLLQERRGHLFIFLLPLRCNQIPTSSHKMDTSLYLHDLLYDHERYEASHMADDSRKATRDDSRAETER